MIENTEQTQEQIASINQTPATSRFPKIPRVIFIATMVVFVASSLIGYISSGAVSLWYLGVASSIFFPVVFLIWGAVTFKKGGNKLVGFAILFFLAALVVGAGTCFINMGIPGVF